MSSIPIPRLITTPVRRLHPDTLREIALVTKQAQLGFLTGAEAFELCEITRRQNARAELSDLADDIRCESCAFPVNPNPHDD